MPYDRPQYRTRAVLGRRYQQGHDGAADVEGSRAVLHHTCDFDPFLREKLLSSVREGLDRHTPELHHPVTGLKSVGERPGDGFDHLKNVQTRGQRLVERRAHPLRIDPLGHRYLEELGLAGRPGRRRVRVGDLGVGVEARGERHGHGGPAQGPLEGPLEVAGRGEPQPSTLGIPHPQLLNRWRRRGTFGSACHDREDTDDNSQSPAYRRLMDYFRVKRSTGTEAYEVFIQIIQGMCRDADTLHRQLDRWRQEMGPTAEGWLGGTYGVTDDDRFIGVVRFESKEAAARNSVRPEQGAWWAETEKCFDGDVTFHDCDEAMMFLDGGADDAGFVQVMQGRVEDPQRFRRFMELPMDMLHQARPEIIGGSIAIEPDGRFTETVAFRSEEAAREGESKKMPEDARQAWEDEMALMQDVTYLDLRHPWFASKD